MYTTVRWVEGPPLGCVVALRNREGSVFHTYGEFLNWSKAVFDLPFDKDKDRYIVYGVTLGFVDSPTKAFRVSLEDDLLLRQGLIVVYNDLDGSIKQATFKITYCQRTLPEHARITTLLQRRRSGHGEDDDDDDDDSLTKGILPVASVFCCIS